jgi:hypothetical protein
MLWALLLLLVSPRPKLVLVDPLDEFGIASQVTYRAFTSPPSSSPLSPPLSPSPLSPSPHQVQGALFHKAGELVESLPLFSPSTATRLLAGDLDAEQSAYIQAATYSAHMDLSAYAGVWLGGVLCESDTGLSTAERFLARLGLAPVVEARRDKYMQQEALGRAGVRRVRQVLTDDWAQARAFIESLAAPAPSTYSTTATATPVSLSAPAPAPGVTVVVKPARGSGSAGVSR